MSEVKAIEFEAEIKQIKTMADSSVNLILSLPEHCREQAKVLLDWHHMAVRGMLALEESDGENRKKVKKIHF